MAITTYTKLPGSMLTPLEAQLAQSTFEDGGGLPSDDYAFAHWSSSPDTDTPVTALEPGGAGITVNSNMEFYPVVDLKSPATLSKSGSNLVYTTAAEEMASASDGSITWESDHKAGSPSSDERNIFIDLAITQSNISNNASGTIALNTQAANVRFGLIAIPVNLMSSVKTAWSKVSEVDGQTYYITLATGTVYVQGQYWEQIEIQVFKDSGSSKVDITSQCKAFFNIVNDVLAGQIYAAEVATLKAGSNTSIEYVNGEIHVTRTSGSGYVTLNTPDLISKGAGYIFEVQLNGVRSLNSPVSDDGQFSVSESTSAQEIITDPLTTSNQNMSGDFSSRSGLDSPYYVHIASANEFAFKSLTITMLPENQAE